MDMVRTLSKLISAERRHAAGGHRSRYAWLISLRLDFRNLTRTSIAQEAMAKFNIEKARYSSKLSSFQLMMKVGHCSVHQARGQHFTKHSSLASTNLLQFDTRKGATWHCIVGRNFGSFVTHGMLLPIPSSGQLNAH